MLGVLSRGVHGGNIMVLTRVHKQSLLNLVTKLWKELLVLSCISDRLFCCASTFLLRLCLGLRKETQKYQVIIPIPE